LSDYGVPLTSINTLSPPTSFNYTFTAAGNYTVTFNAFNQNVNDKKEIIKEMTLTIIP
jgi:surface-anchored protein